MTPNRGKCHFQTLCFNEPFPDFPYNDTTIEYITEQH